MALINNLSQPQLGEIFRRLHALENAAPMNNGAVGRSGFEVYDNGTINVSSGNIIGAGTFSWQGSFSQSGTSVLSGSTTIAGPTGITGQLTIQGATSVTGPFTVTGVTKLDGKTDVGGAFTVTGDTKLNGKTDVGGAFTVTGVTKLGGDTTVSGKLDVTGAMATKGALSVEGVTTLKNDLNVTSGGKITAGAVSLDPSYLSGAVKFTNGTSLASTPNGIQVVSSGGLGALVASNSQASIGFIGGGEVIATSAGVRMNGLPTTTQAANLHVDSAGRIFIKV